MSHVSITDAKKKEKKEKPLQRKVFKWVEVSDRFHGKGKSKSHAQITGSEVAKEYGVPVDVLIKHVEEEIRESENCQTLPFTLLMAFSYAFCVIMHDPVVPLNAIEDSLAHDIKENANFAFTSEWMGHKTIYDVNSQADFWSWAILGLTPLLHQQTILRSEFVNESFPDLVENHSYTVPPLYRGMVLNYNYIIGGFRFVQERSLEHTCTTLKEALQHYAKPCVGGKGYELFPQMPGAHITVNPEEEFWIWSTSDLEEMVDVLRTKESRGWFDSSTKKIEITVPIYNPDNAVHTLVFINFYFSRGGHIWKRIIPMSTYAQWFHGYSSLIPDFIWSCCLFYTITTEGFSMLRACRTRHLNDYFTFWIFVDWFNVLMGLGMVGYFILRVQGTAQLNLLLISVLEAKYAGNQDEHQSLAIDYAELLQNEVRAIYSFRLSAGVYPLLLMLRLFKAFSAQPRLAIVTQTLQDASVDLFHFLLVFMSIFLTYAVAGVILFGRELNNFTTLTRSIVTCFRIMMGDFDWDDLARVGRFEAGVWFVSYIIIIVLLMLNMLMAILMDHYAAQKIKLGEAETLWGEAYQTFDRKKGVIRGNLVSLPDVLSKLRQKKSAKESDGSAITVVKRADDEEEEDEEEIEASKRNDLKKSKSWLGRNAATAEAEEFALINVGQLKTICPPMGDDQALELLHAAAMDFYNETHVGPRIEEILRVMKKLNASTRNMKHVVRRMIGSTQSPENDDNEQAPQNKTEGTAVDHSNDDGVDGPNFMDELNHCRVELRRSAEWISEADQARALKALNDAQAENGALEYPIQSVDELTEWSVQRILADEAAVLAACRVAGIGPEKDALRKRSVGQIVRVVELDTLDGTAKCRVPGVHDVWFGVGAFASMKGRDAADNRRRSEDGSRAYHMSENILGSGENAEMTLEEYQAKAQVLEADLKAGRQTVGEALAAVSELEWRLVREQEEKTKVANKFQVLKKKVVSLTREHTRLLEETKRQNDRISKIEASKKEYYDLVQTMSFENQRLKGVLRDAKEGPSAAQHSGSKGFPGADTLARRPAESFAPDPRRREAQDVDSGGSNGRGSRGASGKLALNGGEGGGRGFTSEQLQRELHEYKREVRAMRLPAGSDSSPYSESQDTETRDWDRSAKRRDGAAGRAGRRSLDVDNGTYRLWEGVTTDQPRPRHSRGREEERDGDHRRRHRPPPTDTR